MLWLSIDVEEVQDMNFNIKWKKNPEINYESVIDWFLDKCENKKATAFVLGSFAKKYPGIVKKISKKIEVASHGYNHELVYKQPFEVWEKEIKDSKKLLEDIIQKPIKGYRAPSWSMPFEKKYYEVLAKEGFEYSSSYFPMKNYMYGNEIDKKNPFKIFTKFGVVEERPIPKKTIPYSGGFYLRFLPTFILKKMFDENSILYIHPYELIDENLLTFFNDYADKNIDYFLAFFHMGNTRKKILKIINGN
ncbi:polysaccharide deacetylase family protein [Caminibacter pacificus]